MFACVKYLDEGLNNYKVPVTFIKKFNPIDCNDFVEGKLYKVFWSQQLSKYQRNFDKLQTITLPSKESREEKKCITYYKAYILRLGETLQDLNKSLDDKRPPAPVMIYDSNPVASSTEDELPIVKKTKSQKDYAEERSEKLLLYSMEARNGLFKKGGAGEKSGEFEIQRLPESDSDNFLRNRIADLETENTSLREENAEVAQLRSLNRQLQEKLLSSKENLIPVDHSRPDGDGEPLEEISLGGGIILTRAVLNAVKGESTVSKFTKSLSVAIWTEETLSTRSTTGVRCRNTRGCKGKSESLESMVAAEARPKLTPEKLAVVSSLMRRFMEEKNMDSKVVEDNI